MPPFVLDLINKVLTECGIISAIGMGTAMAMAIQLARVRKAWEVDRAEATRKLAAANDTIVKFLEEGNKADESVAVALARLEVMVNTVQSRIR